MIVIDSVPFPNVRIVGVEDLSEPLDKYAERTEDGVLHREIIGWFYKHRVTFGAPITQEERAALTALWEKILEPVEFHTVTVPHSDGQDVTYEAYVSAPRRNLRRWRADATYWKEPSVTFTARRPRAGL